MIRDIDGCIHNLNIIDHFETHLSSKIYNSEIVIVKPENYEESVVKFLEIYEKSSFEKFNR